jgi:hypothetical protein
MPAAKGKRHRRGRYQLTDSGDEFNNSSHDSMIRKIPETDAFHLCDGSSLCEFVDSETIRYETPDSERPQPAILGGCRLIRTGPRDFELTSDVRVIRLVLH